MPIDQAKQTFQESKKEAMEWLSHEINTLRSGRVRPDLVEQIPVEVYGTRTPLNGLASISSSDARTLVVSPWDKNSIAPIERAITEADLGVNPAVDGDIIRLAFPALTDEVRQQTRKLLHAKAEEARVRLRQARDDALKPLKQEKENGDITEDDFYDAKKALDEFISQANEEIEHMVAKKDEELEQV